MYLKLNEAQKVVTQANKALELSENNVKALFRLGQAQNKLGLFSESRETLAKALTVKNLTVMY